MLLFPQRRAHDSNVQAITANGFQDRSLTTRTHGIYGSFQLLRVPRLPTQFSPTSNADGCRYVRYHRQILPPTCQWDAQRGFYNFSLLYQD